MKNVTLYIENHDGIKTVSLEDETSVGRTDSAKIVLGDSGLSRLNTSFFRDEDAVFVVDENSTNGTFVNGEKISSRPHQIFDGDRIKIGSQTNIRVEIRDSKSQIPDSKVQIPDSESKTPAVESQKPKTEDRRPKTEDKTSGAPPMLIIAAVGSTLLILFLGIAGYLIVGNSESVSGNKKPNPNRKILASAAIPIRVVDPLGGGDIEDLDELVEAWEVQDAEFEAKDLEAVTTSTDAPQLAVSVADWEKQRAKAMEKRNAQTGLVSIQIPPELQGSIRKQLDQFAKMGITRATLPKDFVSLAQKRMNNELVELPLATEIYYLDNIGTSADSSPFNDFNIITNLKTPLPTNSEGFSILQKLASNYNGQKYDLNVPSDRAQMKRRLLRMFHPDAKAVLEEIAGAYQKKFNRPLKITSLTRSLEYQVDLSRATSNAYRGQTPPHSTGRTFDIAYMQMTAEEQNFIMAKFAELEKAGRVDALHERGQTPCIHTFVFPK
jgi:pSer/pThr/pTyr-binding forkhead associated (FHA) protein